MRKRTVPTKRACAARCGSIRMTQQRGWMRGELTCHVVCNPVYTVYYTLPRPAECFWYFAQRARTLFSAEWGSVGVAGKCNPFQNHPSSVADLVQRRRDEWSRFSTTTGALLAQLGPTDKRKAITDSAAIAAYHANPDCPMIWILVCDDAPQFNWLTYFLALCWIHEGRPYKKLSPVVPTHRELLDDFSSKASGSTTTNCWSTYSCSPQKKAAASKPNSTACSPPTPGMMTWMTELPRPKPRKLLCCWCWNILDSPYIMIQQNWEGGSECASETSVLGRVPRRGEKPGTLSWPWLKPPKSWVSVSMPICATGLPELTLFRLWLNWLPKLPMNSTWVGHALRLPHRRFFEMIMNQLFFRFATQK